ncbi:ATP-binding cassette domain-containing protein [Nonomuraea sp. 10N515B]|uniref:ATP-binding cassette domain-containing protein n=1 Tax=Nonomuraea sp. 10N515B TaxID=3457422 RepID=UPI003FCCC16F
MSDAILVCAGLRKAFADRIAVDGISLSIAEGEIYGLLGPNGAGKTTTISMIAGVLGRDAGEVTIDGRRHDTASVATKALIGYVPQELALYPDLTARENLAFFARLQGLRGRQVGVRTDEVLEIVGLTDRSREASGKLSGGMRRRLNIAIGLLNRPRLLILDEPTAGVDPQSRSAILDSVKGFADQGMAVLYTTHYMEEAERLCDRVGVIDEGRLVAEGTRRELVRRIGEADKVTLTVEGDVRAALRAVERLPGSARAGAGESQIDVLMEDAGNALPEILGAVAKAGVPVRSVEVREPDLEAVFLHLTGKALRD